MGGRAQRRALSGFPELATETHYADNPDTRPERRADDHRCGDRAERIGNPMNIAVVDAGGCLLAFARMDDAWRGSFDIAIGKAWTARAFDVETKALAKLSQPGADFYGIHASDDGKSNDGKVMIFAGGVPIKEGETVIGAVGVSGGNGKQDQGVAEAAAQAFASG